MAEPPPFAYLSTCHCGACIATRDILSDELNGSQFGSFAVGRLDVSHCELLLRVATQSLEKLFGPQDDGSGVETDQERFVSSHSSDGSDVVVDNVPPWKTDPRGRVVALRTVLPLASSGLLSQRLFMRLAFLFISNDPRHHDESQYGRNAEEMDHTTAFDFSLPRYDEAGGVESVKGSTIVQQQQVPLSVWLRLQLRAFWLLASSPVLARAHSCCIVSFVDSLGVSCFHGLSELAASSSPEKSINQSFSSSSEPSGGSVWLRDHHQQDEQARVLGFASRRGGSGGVDADSHLLFFGMQYFGLLRADTAAESNGQHSSTVSPFAALPRTCGLLPSLGWGAVAAATHAAWIPRSLPDHAVLVMLLLRLLNAAGVDADLASAAVATLKRHSVKVFGMDCEVYSFDLDANAFESVRDSNACQDYGEECLCSIADNSPAPASFTVFVEFSRMWLDVDVDVPSASGSGNAQRHCGALAKHRWLCSVARDASDSADIHGLDSRKFKTLFIDVQVPVLLSDQRAAPWKTPPFRTFRAYIGVPPLPRESVWVPCVLHVRSLAQVGKGTRWPDWNHAAGLLVTRLWNNVDWNSRLASVAEASRSLIELVASLTDSECDAGACFGAAGEQHKWTVTYMPGAMWQLRLPALAEVVESRFGKIVTGDVMGVRLHVFEKVAETVPHNHGIPFFSLVLQGQYVQTLWRNVTESSVRDSSPSSDPTDAGALPEDIGQFSFPRRPPQLPSASIRDEHAFVAVSRPFRTEKRPQVAADEHGVIAKLPGEPAAADTRKAPAQSSDGVKRPAADSSPISDFGPPASKRAKAEVNPAHSAAASPPAPSRAVASQPRRPSGPSADSGAETVLGRVRLQQSFFHTHRAGSVYFIAPNWIHTVDAASAVSSEPPTGPLALPAAGSLQRETQRVISLVFRLPTYFGALDAATFYIPENCICKDSENCSCANLRSKQPSASHAGQAEEPDSERAIDAAARAAVRGTYGIRGKEGTPEGSEVLKECREACRQYLARGW